MSLKSWTPCDEIGWDGHYHCPYCDDGEYVNCEYYCGCDESEDDCEKEETYYFLELEGVHAFIKKQIEEQNRQT